MKFNKKAIEPLIATILLVVVAVILVTIVLAWGRNFSTEALNKTNDLTGDNCTGATIAISNCDWNKDANSAAFFIKNTSDTYTFAANDFSCNITEDANILNNQQTIATAITAALAPGATLSTNCVSTTMSTAAATRVTVNVRSETCPNVAVSQIKGCS